MEKIKEALNKLFGDKINEDGLNKILELIQAKIDDATDTKLNTMKADIEKKNTDELKEYKTELAKTIDLYLDNANTEFVEENKHEIESELLVEMSTNIVHGLTDVLKKNNIDFPKSDMDVISDLEEKIIVLERRTENYINESIEDKKQICEYKKAASFMQKTENLTETQKENVKNIISGITFENVEIFNEKVDAIVSELSAQNQNKNMTSDFEILDNNNDDNKDITYSTHFTDSLLK